MTAVEVSHLHKSYNGNPAVTDLSFSLNSGELLGLIGPNGAGKTTTVRLLNGVLAPDSGTARVLELDPLDDGPALRRRTGVLTETPSLDERLTGRENLEIYAELYDVPRSQVRGRVAFLLEAFELDHRADDKVGGYSRGMKQRLALACAVVHQPDVLFLDEPTSGVDPITRREFWNHINGLVGKGVTFDSGGLCIKPAAGMALILGRHIEVEFFVDLLPQRVQAAIKVFVLLLALGLFIVLIWQLFLLGHSFQSSGEYSPTAYIPLYPFAYGMALASTPVCLVLVLEILKTLKKRGQQ